ncbi:MAG: Ig-like domain-containing protein [Myxococcota bacterium]|nr:Ig-like domain-containing protein [Myxococcota bacterium]
MQVDQELVAANLLSYNGQNGNLNFLGIQEGDSFPDENALVNGGPDLSAILDGGTLYGVGEIGTDILPQLTSTVVEGDGRIVAGLPTPLGEGNYTLWFSQNAGPTQSTIELVTQDANQPSGPIVVALNAGGPALSQDGIDFSADQFFLNGLVFVDNDAGNGPQPVFDGTVYETERYGGPPAGPPLQYEIPVAAGNYTVELYFAEIFQPDGPGDGIGARVFDVFVEDVLVLDDFDILAQTGGDINQPIKFNVPDTFAPSTAGNPNALDIDFQSSMDNGKISAIVVRSDDAPVGEATLTVNDGSNNIQQSNFGNGSFVLTNTGAKNITSVTVDVTNALYPDAVFDPFGVAGDTIGKPMTINGGSGTGVEEPAGGYYIGAGGTLGFEAVQLDFNPGVDGGFNPGESVAFSVDMDPNSIAGADKSTLDSGAIPSPWDIGGISGAELIGSSFTVTFEDGTTATGQLQGQTNASGAALQGGSEGLASQSSPDLDVTLTVNGVSEGGAGTYGAGGPTVIINGTAGLTARVTMTKGIIQPVDNNFGPPFDAQLDAQLAALEASDFPANNAGQFETFDVLLTGGDQDISSLFNFTDVPGLELDGPGSGRNEAELPLGFAAGVIDPANGDAPLGPVSAPIFVQFSTNSPPDAVDDSVATTEDTVLAGDVLADNGNGPDSDPDVGDTLTITAVNGVTGDVGQQVTLGSGALLTLNSDGTFSYDPNGAFDGLGDGQTDTDTFDYTLSDGLALDTATVTVTISGLGFPADDIDGDGILNTDDPFAFDGTNGDAKQLLLGGEFLQNFDTDTNDPFSAEAGFSGIIVNPAFDPAGASAADPYGDRTTEAGVSVSGGFLNVASSNDDLFGDSGTSGNNIIKDNYQSAADVTGVDSFEVVGRTANPFFGTAPASFASFGITIGAGGVDDYIKFVYGGAGGGPRIQMAQENSLTGAKEENIPLSSASIDPALVQEIEFKLVVDKVANTLQGTATLLDDLGAELGVIQTSARTISGSLAEALTGQNPLTGNDGGIAYGISITDFGGAGQFTGQWDVLRLTALDELPADLELTKTASDLTPEFSENVTFTLTVDHAGGVDATGVQVEDLLADGFTFVSASGDGTYDAGTGLWDIGTIVSGGSATLDITATVNEPGVGDVVVYRVNPGGTTQAAADASTPDWLGDTLGNNPTAGAYGPGITLTGGNKFGNENGSPVIDLTQLPAPNPAGAVLFETERFGNQQWDFAVDNGNYTVNLYFAEIFADAPGARVFDVEIEGALVLDDYDIFVDAGDANNTAVLQSFTTAVADGNLDIDFTTVTDNAKISAIEIIQQDVAQVFDYNNYAQILAADQPDPDSTPGDGSTAEDDDATVTLSPVPFVNEVTIAATQDAAEPDVDGQFTVSLEEIASTVTTVTYSVAGTAASGVDFDALSGTVDIAPGALSATIDVTVIDDLEIEGAETVVVTLTGVSGDADVALGTADSATVTIADDDVANEVTIEATTDASEPATNGQFTVSLGAAATTDTVIGLTVSGTATADSDYTALATSVTILQGETSALIDVAVLDDLLNEGTEDVLVTLDSITEGDANVVIGAANSAAINILDDEFDVGATVQVSGGTTFGTSALNIQNTSPGGVSIKSVVFDIGTAILSVGLDLSGTGEFLGAVWDPTGEAGDTGSQGLKFNNNDAGLVDDQGNVLPAPTTGGLGYTGVAGVYPFTEQLPGGDAGAPGGYRFMTLDFADFQAGENFVFGVDVDPQSIQGAIGTGQAGAVSGGEIAGTTISITFENATGQEVTVTRELELTGLDTSQAIFDGDPALAAPTLTIAGLIDGERRAVTTEASQTVDISGAPAGATVELYVLDASGYEKHGDNGTETIPDDPFHGNQVDAAPLILSGTADAAGDVSFEVDLGNGAPGAAPATVDDLFFFSAGVVDGAGNLISNLAQAAELKLVPPPAVPIYDAPGVMQFDGTPNTVLELDPDPNLNVGEGSVVFSFNPADTSGAQGLFSKDASGNGDGGHLLLYLDGDTLTGRFQSATDTATLELAGIVAGTEYEVAATFGPSGVALWVDGNLVDSDGLGVTWLNNNEYVQWGGRGWGSAPGAPGFDAPFEGTISDKQIYGEVLDEQQIQELASTSSGANNPPVAADDAIVLAEDTVAAGSVLDDNGSGADSDPDGNALSVTPGSFTTAQGGTFDVDGVGNFTYTPPTDFNGTDTVDYTLSDGLATDTGTVTFTVDPVNDDPVANDDATTTTLEAPVDIDVTANDVDVDGDALTITDIVQPTNGSVVDNGDGTVAYTPGSGFLGDDTFTYTVEDGNGGAPSSAQVTVTVLAAPNQAPVAADDAFSVDEDTVLAGDVLADNSSGPDTDPDGNPLDVTLDTDVANGSLALNTDGTFTYTPNADFNGVDTFTYVVSDGFLDDTATVTITVNPVNDDPVATDDSVSARQGAVTDFDVLGNDSDVDGDTLSVSGTTQPDNGSVVVNPDGTLGYQSDPGFEGTDTFDYTVSDGNGGFDTATVTVDVTALPEPVYSVPGVTTFNGSSGQVINEPPSAIPPLGEGTIAFSFIDDNPNERQGLVVKDASFFGDGGHFAAYVDDGELRVRFQDTDSSVTFTSGIAAGQETEVAATFGPQGVALYVDGSLVGSEAGFDADWLSNAEYLQVGGLGWGSSPGDDSFTNPFSGQIADVEIYGEALSSDFIDQLASLSSFDIA